MQIGISPKVKVPTWLLFIVGVALTAYGSLISDETISTVGLSLIGATPFVFGSGYKASPGLVQVIEGVASDDLLSQEAKDALNRVGTTEA